MMRNIKKTLSWLLVLCMLITLVPSNVLGAEASAETAGTEVTTDESESSEEQIGINENAPDSSEGADDTDVYGGSSEKVEASSEEKTSEEKEGETSSSKETDTSEKSQKSISKATVMDDSSSVSMDTITKNQSVPLNTDSLYKIYHLDCGRKYFSVDQIKQIIDIMVANDFNTLELAVGNDGMRFLLDDMSVTANGTTYSSDAVKAGVQAGNKGYYDAGTNELTEAEMDSIFAYATEKGISIIPLINTPGHMDAILNAASSVTGKTCSYNGSSRTIDVTNAYAVNFTLAFVNKYISYFADKGCTVFNMGCDEYANDKYSSGSMGFGNLVSSGNYSHFINYVNNMAAQVQNAGMTPMAFNDGFYFNGNTSSGTFDTNIAISFWSSGWSGYTSMSASNLAAKGHKIINTNGDWYYILKASNIDNVVTNITNTPYNSVMGSGTMDVAGCMLCFWCDTPGQDYDETEITNLTTQINTFATVNSSVFDLDKEPEESTKTTVTDEATGITVTAPGLTSVTVTELQDCPEIEGAVNVKAYDIVPMTADGKYDGQATVVVPVPSGWNVNKLGAAIVESDGSINKIKGQYDAGTQTYTYTAPHFSTNYLYENKEYEVTKEETFNIVEGDAKIVKISGVNYAGEYTPNNPDIATVEVTGTDATEATTTYTEASVTCNTLISSDSSNNWTAVSGYYYMSEDGNYYPVYAKRSSSWSWSSWSYTYTYTWGYSTTSSTSNVTQIGTQSTTDTKTTPNITVYTQSTTDGTPASTTITFTATGKAGESTTVVIGDTRYTINIISEELNNVDKLTIEYWITNGRPTDSNGNKSYSVSASHAYSEDGTVVSTLVPKNTTKENRTLQYWRCRLLNKNLSNSSTSSTEEQTEDAGDDETYNGVEFTKVRYWKGNWAVYTEEKEWVNIGDQHQLVAYYLEILPVSDELTVTAADWGKKGDGSTSGDYLDPSSSCTVSIQTIYEDGTTNPKTTTATDLKSTTIAYGYWSGGRGVGTLNLNGLEGYQIWKVEAETGSEKYASSSDIWGSYTVDSFTWDNNAMTVYEGDPVDSYTIHNDSNNPSTEGYYNNLMWNENHEAILIKVYVKAKPSDDNLQVIYYDEKFGDTLYNYNINVANGVTFDEITPTPATFSGDNNRIDVSECGIKNTLGVMQKFQTDLTKVPEAVGKYNSELYKYNGSMISEDKKTLYLYYTINTDILSPMFVVDFGLPITFNLSDVVSNVDSVTEVTVINATRYGTLDYDSGTQTFTYTPTKILQSIDVLTINIKFIDDTSPTTTNAGVMPATTVYYEEGFAEFKGFEGGSKGTDKQATQIAGESQDEYGYDRKYSNETAGPSNNKKATSKEIGDSATFTFTGTGVDIYANTTTQTGKLFVQVKGTNGTVKYISVDTAMKNGSTDATTAQGVNAYNVPVVSLNLGTYNTYTVTISHIKSGTDENVLPVYLDGYRVYGTLEDQSNEYYRKDKEDNPSFIEVRDQVLSGLSISSTDNLSQINAALPTDPGAVVVASSDKYTTDNVNDLLTNGPKNEIYLQPGQALVFKIRTDREVQLGLKALDNTVTYSINEGNSQTLTSSTDMFYTVLDKNQNSETGDEQTITINNNIGSSGILSITKLKICDDPNAKFGKLTAEDIKTALDSLASGDKKPNEPTGSDKGNNGSATNPSQKPSKPSTDKKDIKVSGIKISGISNKIAAGKNIKLTAQVYPANASNKAVKWSSSNTKIASVSKDGLVKIKKKTGGKAVVIKASALDGSGKTAYYKIKSMKGAVKKISVIGPKTARAGKTVKLKSIVKAGKGANTKVKWSSDNVKYATVSPSGVVRLSKAGKGKSVKITVKATDGTNKKKTLKIKIK